VTLASCGTNTPVASLFAERTPATAELSLAVPIVALGLPRIGLDAQIIRSHSLS
jgi:ABC-type dipeptide/oligopeptide/nickel transport system permease component